MRGRAFAWIALAYAVALAVALVVGRAMPSNDPVAVAASADVAATIAIFAFSYAFSNSSFYDAYWSLAPIALCAYWMTGAQPDAAGTIRPLLTTAAVALWGLRLTYNWGRGWGGIDHEDWRYRDLHTKFPRAYWLVSFAGIHMLPTVQVFFGMLPCYVVLQAAASPEIGPLDWLAVVVAFGAIKLEADADKQLHEFVTGPRAEGDTLTTGLWSVSRHPNYLGEILFWWGLYLFGLAANPAWWWTIVGPLSITLLFVFVSLPLIEERASERRRDYDAVRAKVPILLPRLRRKL